MDEDHLLKQIKAGDKKAFEVLFDRYLIVLEEYAFFYSGIRQVSEDIVQEIFLDFWNRRSSLVIKSSLKAYLYRAVHNSCIQYLRHLIITEKYSSEQKMKYDEAKIMNRLFFEDGLNRLYENDIERIVESSLRRLPDKTRKIFRLSRVNHMKNSEIAMNVNLSEKSVEYHISKALTLLRIELRDYLPLATCFILIL